MEAFNCILRYKQILANHCFGELIFTPPEGYAPLNQNVDKVLYLCIDKSGSMYGAPIENVKQGTILVGEMHQDRKLFKDLYFIPFDDDTYTVKFVDRQNFDKNVDLVQAGGGNDFVKAFKEVEKAQE